MPARSRRWPDPRVKPPFGVAEIDWAHPLARGLMWYVPLNEGGGPAVDLVHGLSGAPGGGASRGGGPRGLGATLSSSYFTFPNLPIFRVANATLVASARSTGSVTTNQPIVNVNYDGSSVQYMFVLTPVTDTSIAGYSFYNGNWERSLIATDFRGDNLDHSFAGSNDGARLRFYADGVLNSDNGQAGASQGSLVNTNTLDIGRYANNPDYFTGTIYYVGLYSRALTASEVQWLHVEPYALLRPIVRRRYSVAGAAEGGSSIPVFAHHYRQMRGAT